MKKLYLVNSFSANILRGIKITFFYCENYPKYLKTSVLGLTYKKMWITFFNVDNLVGYSITKLNFLI